MKPIGRIQDHLLSGQNLLRPAEVNHLRGQHANTGMAMPLVVPGEELMTERSAVSTAAKPVREARSIFERSELALRERIVIGDIGSAMSP